MHPRDPELSGGDAAARIARALQELPDGDPPADGWDRVRARLGAPVEAPTWWPTVAVAAGVSVVLVGLLLRAGTPPAPVSAPTEGAPFAPATVQETPPGEVWQRRSAELERLLVDLPEPSVTRASTSLTAALLEDRIALVDERLSQARVAAAPGVDAEALWRERVLLLDSLVQVRYAGAVDPTI